MNSSPRSPQNCGPLRARRFIPVAWLSQAAATCMSWGSTQEETPRTCAKRWRGMWNWCVTAPPTGRRCWTKAGEATNLDRRRCSGNCAGFSDDSALIRGRCRLATWFSRARGRRTSSRIRSTSWSSAGRSIGPSSRTLGSALSCVYTSRHRNLFAGNWQRDPLRSTVSVSNQNPEGNTGGSVMKRPVASRLFR